VIGIGLNTNGMEATTPRVTVTADGNLTQPQLFVNQGGESVAVDDAGNVYLAAGQIYVYNPAGALIDSIDVPERPIHLVFGGSDKHTLFIAARTSLYSVCPRRKP
jgi:sugar lactone lactonase YvrE